MDFACRRHDILTPPHKRDEVKRSVGLLGLCASNAPWDEVHTNVKYEYSFFPHPSGKNFWKIFAGKEFSK